MANNSIPDGPGFEGIKRRKDRNNLKGNARDTSSFDREVEKIMSELGYLLISKHQDYGPKNISEAPGGAINGLLVRMHDKMARLKNLHYNNKSANYESIEDTYKDLANYAIIALMVLRGKWDN